MTPEAHKAGLLMLVRNHDVFQHMTDLSRQGIWATVYPVLHPECAAQAEATGGLPDGHVIFADPTEGHSPSIGSTTAIPVAWASLSAAGGSRGDCGANALPAPMGAVRRLAGAAIIPFLRKRPATANLCGHAGTADVAGCLFLGNPLPAWMSRQAWFPISRRPGGLYRAGAQGCGGVRYDGGTGVARRPASGYVVLSGALKSWIGSGVSCGVGDGIYQNFVLHNDLCRSQGSRWSGTYLRLAWSWL